MDTAQRSSRHRPNHAADLNKPPPCPLFRPLHFFRPKTSMPQNLVAALPCRKKRKRTKGRTAADSHHVTDRTWTPTAASHRRAPSFGLCVSFGQKARCLKTSLRPFLAERNERGRKDGQPLTVITSPTEPRRRPQQATAVPPLSAFAFLSAKNLDASKPRCGLSLPKETKEDERADSLSRNQAAEFSRGAAESTERGGQVPNLPTSDTVHQTVTAQPPIQVPFLRGSA